MIHRPSYELDLDVTASLPFVSSARAHCHNFAGTRALLWDRLADWAGGIGSAR